MSAPRTDYFTIAAVLARDAAKQAESEWVRERLRHFEHWPRMRDASCSDATCGDVENCRTCRPRSKSERYDDSQEP